MGLDQAILIGPKGGKPAGALMQFRKHDRLHGFMERLSYQKGIVDPFEQVEVDWTEVEKQVHEELKAQLNVDLVMNPDDETMKDIEKSSAPKEPIVYNPTFDLSGYSKGRLPSDVLVPLQEEDFGYLVEDLAAFMDAESMSARDKVFPPCKGLFFGESTPHEWEKTIDALDMVLNQFGLENFDYYYICNW